MKKFLTITAVSAIVLFAGAQTTLAMSWYDWGGDSVVITNYNNTTIINSVSSSVSTGGNSGEVSTGETSVDLFIETIVNGETVEYIDEHYEGSDIPEGGIYTETHYESEDGTVVVDTNIVVNTEAEEIERPVWYRPVYRTRILR